MSTAHSGDVVGGIIGEQIISLFFTPGSYSTQPEHYFTYSVRAFYFLLSGILDENFIDYNDLANLA
jgi:hypothetical protein